MQCFNMLMNDPTILQIYRCTTGDYISVRNNNTEKVIIYHKIKRKSLKIIIILLFKTTYRTDINLCSISITKLNVFSRETILSQFKI